MLACVIIDAVRSSALASIRKEKTMADFFMQFILNKLWKCNNTKKSCNECKKDNCLKKV